VGSASQRVTSCTNSSTSTASSWCT
jgi:hypothetical protein